MSTAVAEPKRRKAKVEYTTLKSPVPIANKLRQLVALLADDPDDAVELQDVLCRYERFIDDDLLAAMARQQARIKKGEK